MSISLQLLVATLVGCGSEPVDLSKTPDGRLCQRAYSSTIDDLTDMFNQAGKEIPTWPAKDTYIEKCVAMGFDEPQLKCLDPKWSLGDPEGCKATMEPVQGKAKELTKWLIESLKSSEGTPEAKEKEGGAE